jgi:hypothetical protein
MALNWKLVDSLRRRQSKVDRWRAPALIERHTVGWKGVTRNLIGTYPFLSVVRARTAI